MKKLLIVSSAKDIETGGGNHVLAIAEGLIALNSDMLVIVFEKGTLSEHLKEKGINVQIILIKNKFDLLSYLQLRSLAKKMRPCYLHCHGERAMFIANWAVFGLKDVYTVTTVHRVIERTLSWKPVIRFFYAIAERLTLQFATDHLISVSDALKHELILRRKVKPEKITVIHHGIRLFTQEQMDWFKSNARELRLNLGIPNDVVIIGSIGRLAIEKGYKELLTCVSSDIEHFKNYIIVLVGDGDYRNQLESYVEKYKLNHIVKFVGHQSNINLWLALFDVFVLPSSWESFGLAIAEAMGMRKAVIAMTGSGPDEIIQNSVSGILVNPKNPKELLDAILRLAKNPEIRTQIENNAFLRIKNEFSVGKMIFKLKNFYELTH